MANHGVNAQGGDDLKMKPTSMPNKAQEDWREEVRELGSIISGGPAVIHHPAGRSAKHNKVAIGHWWLIPLTDEEHKHLHNNRREFEAFFRGYASPLRWDYEKELFSTVCKFLNKSPELHIIAAIEDYRK